MSVYNRKSWVHNGTKHWIHNGKHYHKKNLEKWQKEGLDEYLYWSIEDGIKDYNESRANWIKYKKQ